MSPSAAEPLLHRFSSSTILFWTIRSTPSRACASGGLNRRIGDQDRFQPAANARRDRLFPGRSAFADALGHGLNGVRALERLDLFGEFGNVRPRFRTRLRVRAGKA